MSRGCRVRRLGRWSSGCARRIYREITDAQYENDLGVTRVAVVRAQAEAYATGADQEIGVPGGCQGPRASSRDSAMERRSSSEKGRPMSWTPMGRPPEDVEMGMVRPGSPARLSHCEWRMVSR